MRIFISVIIALVALSFLSDVSIEPTCPFILFAYSVFDILSIMFESGQETNNGKKGGAFHTFKANFASFFGYDINDYYGKRYQQINKNHEWDGYKKYSEEKKKMVLKEYDEVVKFLGNSVKIDE